MKVTMGMLGRKDACLQIALAYRRPLCQSSYN